MRRDLPLAYAAALNVIAIDLKVADQVADESALQRPLWTLARLLLSAQTSKARRVISRRDSGLIEEIQNIIASLRRLESGPSIDLDHWALTSSRLFEVAYTSFAWVVGLPSSLRIQVSKIGRGVGVMVAVKDALVDLSSDRRAGKFNPLLRVSRLMGPSPSELLSLQMTEAAGMVTDALSTLPGDPILRTILIHWTHQAASPEAHEWEKPLGYLRRVSHTFQYALSMLTRGV